MRDGVKTLLERVEVAQQTNVWTGSQLRDFQQRCLVAIDDQDGDDAEAVKEIRALLKALDWLDKMLDSPPSIGKPVGLGFALIDVDVEGKHGAS